VHNLQICFSRIVERISSIYDEDVNIIFFLMWGNELFWNWSDGVVVFASPFYSYIVLSPIFSLLQRRIGQITLLCLWLNWINKSGTNPHNELTDIMNIFEWTRLIFPKCSFPCKTAHRRQLHMIPSFIVLFVQCDVDTYLG
jgi:hypothetical protein